MLSSFFKRVTSYFSIKPGSFRLKQFGGGSFYKWYSTQFICFICLRISMWFRHIYIHGIYNPSIEFTKKIKRKRDSLALNSLGLENILFCLSLIAQSGEAQELVWFSSML